jgi:RimJ/RimL family protein N-acetyltransferase
MIRFWWDFKLTGAPPLLSWVVSQMQMNQRVAIRPYEDTDASEMSVAARESVAEVSPWMPWCHSEYSVADAAAWVRTTRGGHADGSMYDFAIMDANGSYAGGCGVNHINRMDRFANLGYWVRTSLAGRGIAPAAVLQLISWTFANTTLNRVEIVVAVDNVRSQRVAEKVGAHRDAVLKKRVMVRGLPSEAVLYSVVRPD